MKRGHERVKRFKQGWRVNTVLNTPILARNASGPHPNTMLTTLPNSQGKVLHIQMKVPHLKMGEDLGGKVYACVSNTNYQFDTRERFAKINYFSVKKLDNGKLKTHRVAKDDLPLLIPEAKFLCCDEDQVHKKDECARYAPYQKAVFKFTFEDQTFILSGKRSYSDMPFTTKTPKEWRGVK